MGLYSFSKKSWHVKFYKWLFDEDPTIKFRTMCPYFWTYVLIMLFLPLVILIRMFGKMGKDMLVYLKDYKQNKFNLAVAELQAKMDAVDLTPSEAYKIYKSKCYQKYGGYVDVWKRTEGRDTNEWGYVYCFYDLRMLESNRLHKISIDKNKSVVNKRLERANKRLERAKRNENFRIEISNTYDEWMTHKWFEYLTYAILIGVFVSLLYVGYNFISYVGPMIPWLIVGGVVLWILGICAVVGLLWLFIKYMVKPFFSWLRCIKMPSCGLCNIMDKFFGGFWDLIVKVFLILWFPIKWVGIGIGRLFAIIGHMIYSTYKKQCPMIEWKDE